MGKVVQRFIDQLTGSVRFGRLPDPRPLSRLPLPYVLPATLGRPLPSAFSLAAYELRQAPSVKRQDGGSKAVS